MRAFFWDKIPDEAREKSIWKGVDDMKARVNNADLVRLFAAAEKKEPKKDKAKAHEKKESVSLVNPEKSQAVVIALRTIKLPGPKIASSLVAMDDAISLDHLSSLKRCIPTMEDYKAIDEYKGPHEQLGQCEQFFLALKHIQMLPLRVDIMLTPDPSAELKIALDSATTFLRASEQIKESKALKRMLEVILKYGNYMNGGTARGGAYGFKLDILGKLKDIRGADKGTSFATLLAIVCKENYKECLTLQKELSECQKAAEVNFESVRESYVKMNGIYNTCEKQASVINGLINTDGLKKHSERFTKAAKPLLDKFKQLDTKGNNLFKELKEAYGEPELKSGEFFGYFAALARDFNEALELLK